MTDSPADAEALILAGLEAHQAGRLDEAERLYDRALRLRPGHADALNLAGALVFARGRALDAITLIRRAIKAHPRHLDAHLNLAEALEKTGRAAEAVEACQKALLLQPDFVDAHVRLARLNAENGPAEAALAFSRVALALEPGGIEALCARGLALRRLTRFAEADVAYQEALALAPDDVAALAGRAALLADLEITDEAARLYRQALALKPRDTRLLLALGGVVESDGETAAALVVYDRALAIEPGSAEILFRRGCCLRDTGAFEAAEAAFRASLAANADHAPTLLALARMKRLAGGADERRRLARLTTDPAQPPRHRVQAGFALGEVLDRAGEPDAAFRRFAEANVLYGKIRAAGGERFERAELRGQVELTEARLALDYARDTEGWGDPSETPVFVVGLPRSGTTLVEQICASHSKVAGAGELRLVQADARAMAAGAGGRERLGEWDPALARAQAGRHLRELERRGGGAARVVDKTPLNLMRLGLIGALFPNARVIRCRRDSRDVTVSNHTMFFGQGNLFSTDQSDCAYAVRQIERLGDAWLRHSRLRVLDVVYEDLVADLDAQIPRIIDFLGVAWEPACLAFQDTNRQVTTPSSWQVRQPIYASSVGRWRRYEKHLGPMLRTLAETD